eukprot:TRINITY_DN6130_c0_g1_i6.p1 TRINITY_DN6130_c0_g1~~TRINITY_DN6130_c0_g1_i6.p1  ORF type:complete len:122 (-),score=22.09 TRINITY_DN6130_c0_g1_i6:168-533(-)
MFIEICVYISILCCFYVFFFFFFFKQKTAYEMQRGLVGSEMCIRDRYQNGGRQFHMKMYDQTCCYNQSSAHVGITKYIIFSLYTSLEGRSDYRSCTSWNSDGNSKFVHHSISLLYIPCTLR